MKKHYFDPTIHGRRSVRLPHYDYSLPGPYFVTVCLDWRQPLLAIPEVRKIVEENWQALPQRYPGIKLDEFIIMSDHIHFILWLNPQRECRPTLGQVVGAYKSLTARAALEYLRATGHACGKHFWQRDFNEHVIQNEAELQERQLYIRNNPIKDDLKHNRIL